MANTLYGYIIDDMTKVPAHLRFQSPSLTLSKTKVLFKRPLADICPGGDGMVKMAGAIEFQATITPRLLEDYCDPDEIYSPSMKETKRFRCVYDPEIQRGEKEIKDGKKGEFLREPEIRSMMEDIEKDRFECPQLTWNVRAGETAWVYNSTTQELQIYQGLATRPDSNHRHHAIIRFHKKFLDWVKNTEGTTYGIYNPDREYNLIIYTDDTQGEAHRFYVYNLLGWKVPTSAAHYIESKTDQPVIFSKFARMVMEASGILGTANVEIITNQLSKNSVKMLTFGTLVEALKTAFPGVTADDLPNVQEFLVKFLEELHRIRPKEIALLSLSERQRARANTLADQAVLWAGYFRLAAHLYQHHRGGEAWREIVQRVAFPKVDSTTGGEIPFRYCTARNEIWEGDLFDRRNPLWMEVGILVPAKSGGLRVNNIRQARQAAFEVLKEIVVEGKDLSSPRVGV